MTKIIITCTLSCLCLLTFIGCGQDDPVVNQGPDLSNLLMQAPPNSVQSITEAKVDFKPGSPITVHGRIGGRRNPFIKDLPP